jgi:DNA polymerase-3 subunit epsilon
VIIIGGDIETTGLEPGDHKIIEVYLGAWDLATRKLVDEFYTRIDPQRSIAIAAQQVHGISIHDLQGCPLWEDVAGNVHNFLYRGALIVGHNWKSFDGPFINYELRRVKLPEITVPVLDTMRNGRWATPNGKVPTLGELCFAANIPYDADKAHAADYDVKVMMDAFFRGLDWGAFQIKQEILDAAA